MEYEKITIFLQLINTIILPLGYYLYKYIKQWRNDNKLRDEHDRLERELLKTILMALTRDKIFQSGDFFTRLKAIPAKTKARLLDIGCAFLRLNGEKEDKDLLEMIEKIKSLKVDDGVMERWHASQFEAYRKDV